MDETDYPNALPPGYEFEGYRIERVLGQGGFGITYLAYEPALDRKVAIKEFLPGAWAIRAADGISVTPLGGEQREAFEWGRGRFVDEAKTLVKFEHPNIVTVFRSFEANGTAYYVMRFVEGKSLDAVLGASGTLTEEEIDEVFLPILDGLEAVHKQGIIHRDIKPANIFIRNDGVPVLIDFGAARVVASGKGAPLTVILTPGYAPHEQYDSEGNQGPWTDIYAVGATLYRCVTGERPPIAPTRMSAERYGKPDPLVPAAKAAKGQYRRGLLAAIDAALKIGESERPQRAVELHALLAATVGKKRRMTNTKQPVPSVRHSWRIAAMVAILLGATGVGVYAWYAPSQETRQSTEQRGADQDKADRQWIEKEAAAKKEAEAAARKLKFERHISSARDAISNEDWPTAKRSLDEATALFPEAKELIDLKRVWYPKIEQALILRAPDLLWQRSLEKRAMVSSLSVAPEHIFVGVDRSYDKSKKEGAYLLKLNLETDSPSSAQRRNRWSDPKFGAGNFRFVRQRDGRIVTTSDIQGGVRIGAFSSKFVLGEGEELGTSVWQREIKGDGLGIWAVTSLRDRGVLVVGNKSIATKSQQPTSTRTSRSAAWIASLDDRGQIIGQTTLEGLEDELAYKIVHLSDGQFGVLIGTRSRTDENNTLSSWLVVLDKKGNRVQRHDYCKVSPGLIANAIPRNAGGFVCAWSEGDAVVVIAVDAGNVQQWERRHKRSRLNVSIFESVHGEGYLLAGGTWGNSIWVARTDSAANLIWEKTYEIPAGISLATIASSLITKNRVALAGYLNGILHGYHPFAWLQPEKDDAEAWIVVLGYKADSKKQ